MRSSNGLAVLVLLGLVHISWAGKADPVPLRQARTEISESELLDIGIRLFDAGLPEDPEELRALEKEGVLPDVRRSEATYIPMRLMQTLQTTGYWGAVRLIPAANVSDVVITGTILRSNGKELRVDVHAVDARGIEWLKKKYEREANPVVYLEKENAQNPYQDLYHQIANDLVEARMKRGPEDVRRIRDVSQLKFAADLAPEAFQEYLSRDKKGRYAVERLPAAGDPMMDRLVRIRERDDMFVDTLNAYYADFYARMDEPYREWRAFSYEEQLAYDKLRRAARLEKILGVAAIIGGIAAATSDDRAVEEAGGAGVLVGIAVFQDGREKSQEAKMHLESLRELAASLDADVAPLLVDVEGEILRLSGSADTQYAAWRDLLAKIFRHETGLPHLVVAGDASHGN